MSERITVLKLGGSVLAGAADVDRAVHEIYRFHRRGDRVIAVVSAFQGTTDRLLASGRSAATDDRGLAGLLASGERHAARVVEAALGRAGIPVALLDPCDLRLRTRGPRFDADPIDVDPTPIRAAFGSGAVAIVPGFFGEHEDGGVALLGRGGSDLTALFLAAEFDARSPTRAAQHAVHCRLVKDVPALFEWDPALPGPNRPRAFSEVTFGTAQRVGGRILQPKAVAFARSRDLEFELADWNSITPTRVGAAVDRFRSVSTRPRLRVALLGCGAVNREVLERLDALPEHFEVTRILVRDVAGRASDPRFTADADNVVVSPKFGAVESANPVHSSIDDRIPDLVIEALGGEEPAAGLVARALDSGVSVITANKTLLARHRDSLSDLANRRGVALLGSACVGGGVPLLETAARLAHDVTRLECVLNGTTTFVLDRLARGRPLERALGTARRCGLAERDAARDLEGVDAAEKLVLLARSLGDPEFDVADVSVDCSDLVAKAAAARSRGYVLAQIGVLQSVGSTFTARVELRAVPPDHPLARKELPIVRESRTRSSYDAVLDATPMSSLAPIESGESGESAADRRQRRLGIAREHAARLATNVAVFRRRDGTRVLVRGTGAGGRATAEAIVADALDLSRRRDPRCETDERMLGAHGAAPAAVGTRVPLAS